MCLLIIWSDVTVREYTRRLHTSECKIKIQKITYLFITIKVQFITISSVIPYISETNSTSNSLKKKNPQEKKKEGKGKVKERKKRWKRGEEEKREEEQGERKEKRRKKRRENEREGEGEERRGRERRGENRESDTRNVSPSPDAFPSAKLGNNTTPIKGRLGKNTTPTGRGPTELNHNPQVDTLQRRPSFEASFRADSNCTPEKAKDSEYGLHSNRAIIYKKVKALENSRNRFRFSMNQH